MDRTTRTLMALVLLLLVAVVHAQRFGGYYGPNTNGNGAPGSGYGPVGNPGSRPGNVGGSGGFDINEVTRVRAMHGIIAAIAMVALFPSGAILARLVPGRAGLWLHSLAQLVALAMLVAAVALGIHLVKQVQVGTGRDLMGDSNPNYHFIIGIVVMACLALQPAFGLLHHERFKILRRRQLWSYVHLINGRVFITLGIVNGALGLWIAGASNQLKIAYVTAAVVMWGLWMWVAGWREYQIWRDNGMPWRWRRLMESGLPF